jgi:hypothetical protein
MYQVSEIPSEISCGYRVSLDDVEIARDFYKVVQAPIIPIGRGFAQENPFRHKSDH